MPTNHLPYSKNLNPLFVGEGRKWLINSSIYENVHFRNSNSGSTSMQIDSIQVYGEKTANYLSCTGDCVGYRFGFNGQEKDNEISGIEGSHNTAEYWMYDTRLARRWNVDPVDQISISNYACFGNNPIFNIDIKGNKSEGWIKDKDGKASYDKDINNQSDLEDAQRNGRLCDYTYEGQQVPTTLPNDN